MMFELVTLVSPQITYTVTQPQHVVGMEETKASTVQLIEAQKETKGKVTQSVYVHPGRVQLLVEAEGLPTEGIVVTSDETGQIESAQSLWGKQGLYIDVPFEFVGVELRLQIGEHTVSVTVPQPDQLALLRVVSDGEETPFWQVVSSQKIRSIETTLGKLVFDTPVNEHIQSIESSTNGTDIWVEVLLEFDTGEKCTVFGGSKKS